MPHSVRDASRLSREPAAAPGLSGHINITNRMSRVLFETERLMARHLEPGDVGPLLEVYGDPNAMRWVGDGRPISEAACIRWLEVTEDNYRTRGYGMSALVDRESGEVIGFCGLVHPGGQVEAELKYALKHRYRGVGLATESAGAMLRYGARVHGLSRVIATAAPENAASHRVLEKVGMIRAGLRRNEDGSHMQVFEWHANERADTP